MPTPSAGGQRLEGVTTSDSATDTTGEPTTTTAESGAESVSIDGNLAGESSTDEATVNVKLHKRESLDEISAQANPTLNSSGARHRIYLQQQRQQLKAQGGHRQRAHTVATSSPRRSSGGSQLGGRTQESGPTAQSSARAAADKVAKLAAAAQQSRHGERFGGHSIAFLINQQGALTPASSLKPTGAKLGALAPSVASAHAKRAVVLYRCKGRRRVATERIPLTEAQLSAGDSYVLDAVDTIFVCLGAESNRMEKAQARALAIAINDNEGGRRAKIETVNLQAGNGAEAAEVLEQLQKGARDAGADDAFLPSVMASGADEDDADTDYEREFYAATVLYEVGGDTLPHIIAQGRNLRRELLATNGAFVLLSKGELFVWIGRKAAADIAEAARVFAVALQAGTESPPENVPPPAWPTDELRQGVETTAFTAKFSHWELSADLSVAAQRSAPPLESQAFRARALTASGLLPSRPAAFENVKPTPKPHERQEVALYAPKELRQAVAGNSLPPGVEGDKLENHLSDADFEAEFGMTKAEFVGACTG